MLSKITPSSSGRLAEHDVYNRGFDVRLLPKVSCRCTAYHELPEYLDVNGFAVRNRQQDSEIMTASLCICTSTAMDWRARGSWSTLLYIILLSAPWKSATAGDCK